jgi:hypothetical protein
MTLVWLLGLFFGDHSPLGLFNSIFFGMGLAGLWGYLDDTPIGWRAFWIGYFSLTVAGVVYAIGSAFADPNMRTWPELWLLIGIAGVLTAPHWFALWRYAFRSPKVWTRSDVA